MSTNNRITPPLAWASPSISTREAALKRLSEAVGEQYPAADLTVVSTIENSPSAREVLLDAARLGKAPSAAAINAATAADALRAEVPAMRDKIMADTFDERLAQVMPAIVRVATRYLSVLTETVALLDDDEPLSRDRAWEQDRSQEFKKVEQTLAVLGILAGAHGYPVGGDAFDRALRLIAVFIDVPDVTLLGHDEVTRSVREFVWEVARSASEVDLHLVRVAQGHVDGLTLRMAESTAEVRARIRRLDDASVRSTSLEWQAVNTHPAVEHWH